MIDVADLDFVYARGEFRLRAEQLHVGRGEQVAIIGPSGSGKTTLLHLIAGILSPRSGRVSVAGTNLNELSETARRNFRIRNLGLVFQEFELIEYLNVLNNIVLPFRINNSLRLTGRQLDRARMLATQLEVHGQLHRYPAQLSQGEKQRVAVCRALIADPQLILADEPTGNLDPENKDRVMRLLLQYVTEHQVTLLTVTHDHGLLDRFQRVIDFDQFRNSASGGRNIQAQPSGG